MKEALSICEAVITDFPESDGATKCKILKHKILQPNLTLKAESFVPNNKSSLVLVTYKNLEALDLKIYKIKKSQLSQFNSIYRSEEKQKFLSKLNAEKNWTPKLKNESDYQNHTTEIIIPSLENGIYIIKAETKTNDSVFATTVIQATDFALIETQENSKVAYQVIDRNNGAPIVNANIEVSYSYKPK